MKKIVVFIVILCNFIPVLWANERCRHPRLSRDEYRAKQKEYIIENAGLTSKEAAQFFPLYFELQDKTKELNDDSWNWIRKGNDIDTNETDYEEINDKIVENRIATSRLEKDYLAKFKKILSSKKIFLVRRAELRFHRKMIKEMHHRVNTNKGK